MSDSDFATVRRALKTIDQNYNAEEELAALARIEEAYELEKRAHERTWNHKARIIDELERLRAAIREHMKAKLRPWAYSPQSYTPFVEDAELHAVLEVKP